MKRTLVGLASLSAAALLDGCGGGRHFVRPNADFSTIKVVTVLPFDNVTGEKMAGERVQRLFVSELLNLGAFEVVEPGLAARMIRRESIEVATISPDEIKKIGRDLKVQALFLGTLVEYDEGRTGATPSPRVTLQLRLVETEKGLTLWNITRTGGGASFSGRMFGIGGNTAMAAAEDLIREELAELGW